MRHGRSFLPVLVVLHSRACVDKVHSKVSRPASDQLHGVHARISCTKAACLRPWCRNIASMLRGAWCVQQYDDVSTLREVFEKFGRCSEVHLPRNKQTGNPKGFGFIEYHTSRHADGYASALHARLGQVWGARASGALK